MRRNVAAIVELGIFIKLKCLLFGLNENICKQWDPTHEWLIFMNQMLEIFIMVCFHLMRLGNVSQTGSLRSARGRYFPVKVARFEKSSSQCPHIRNGKFFKYIFQILILRSIVRSTAGTTYFPVWHFSILERLSF